MLCRALVIALGLILAVTAGSQAEVGVDRPVPADALAYVAADSLESLEALLASKGGLGAMLPSLLAAPEVDRRRPLAMTWLASGARLLHVPVADPAAFVVAHAAQPTAGWRRAVPGAGYVMIVSDDAPPPDQLEGEGVAAPRLPGAIRGFVRDALWERLGLVAPEGADDFVAHVRRADFAARSDGAAAELELAVAPEGTEGVLAAIARAEIPATPNPYLAALPAGSQIVTSWRATPEIAAAFERLMAMAMRSAGFGRAMERRLERLARHWASVTGGDAATALVGFDGAAVSIVQASACRDREKMRRLLRQTMRQGADHGTGIRVVELRRSVANIDGVEVDEQHLRITAPDGATSPAATPAFVTGPVRYAYPPGAVVSTTADDGLATLQDAIRRLTAGTIDPALAAAIDPRAVYAGAVDVHSFWKGRGASAIPAAVPRWASLDVIPRSGAVHVRLRGPSTLLRGYLPKLLSAASTATGA